MVGVGQDKFIEDSLTGGSKSKASANKKTNGTVNRRVLPRCWPSVEVI